jgi:NADH-quinone oxidoreductase subunit L
VIGLASLVILLPFVAAFAGMLFGRKFPASLIACLPMAGAAVLSGVMAFWEWRSPGVRDGVLTHIPTGSLDIRIGLSVDGTAAVVGFMVCCVALAVQVYSVSYMNHAPAGPRETQGLDEAAGEPPEKGPAPAVPPVPPHGEPGRYSSYAAFISLFTAAMLLVVYAGDLLLLYAGWEVMGVCSYFLIGHHWEDRANSRAAVKAFLVTRLGDVGFLFGIFVLGMGAHSFWIGDVLARLSAMPHATLVAATLLLLCGVAGKSAQFPLHTWLPDAMAGPTPISALIHAATMVAAGIYVVVRLYPAFLDSSPALTVLGVMAAISMVGSALAALAQDDLKRVLAYSTISQLAVMAGGLAVGAWNAALFHLLTHGAFKALLFLAAGCVITAVGSNMLRDMGGLRRAMPVTFWSMTIGFAALAGLPPASGWFSKDSIIEAAQHQAVHGYREDVLLGQVGVPGQVIRSGVDVPGWSAWLVYLALLVTVALTAAYAMRAWLLTFFGAPRTVRDAPPLMRYTVAVLAVPALVLGFFGLGAEELRPALGSALLSLALVAAGAGATYWIWQRRPSADPALALGRAGPVFAAAFYVDDVYDRAIVRPVRALAAFVVRFDGRVVDGAVVGAGRGARTLGGLLRRSENGNPQAYLTGLLTGVAIVVLAVVIFT